MNNSFGILGGDKRQLYLAESLADDGCDVYISGFELSAGTQSLCELPQDKLMQKCGNIILPLPVSTDGRTLNAPYSENEIIVDDDFVAALANKNVFGGMMSRLTSKNDKWESVNWEDYYLREDFAVNNAIPTTEGAIALAIQNYDGMICGSSCLVTGFGRIGKTLTRILVGMGAKTYTAARKPKDLAYIRSMGAVPLRYPQIRRHFDIIFNTVPDLVIDSTIVNFQDPDTLMIELASAPGGIDRRGAVLKDIKVIDAPSLPGKFSPKAAGFFIKEAVYNMLEE